MRNGRKSRLGDVLVESGSISIEQLREIVTAQEGAEGRPKRFGIIAQELGYATEDEVAKAVAEQIGLPFVDLREEPPARYAANLIPEGIAKRYNLVAHKWAEDGVTVAMSDPTEILALDDMRMVFGRTKVEVKVATAGAVAEAVARIYRIDLPATDLLLEPQPEDITETMGTGVHALEASAQMAPIVRALNSLLSDAIRARATDIHLEPQSKGLKVRYRIDGILKDVMELPKSSQLYITSRMKIMASMDISERRQPQDGRTSLTIDGKAVDARISTLPTYWGEKVVVRLLPVNPLAVSLDGLGMDDVQLRQLKDALASPQGLIIFTGPTGAGKTSTMYASLSHIMSPDHNMVTLEDPIESQIEGLNQVQIDERSGITFASGLRSILRQDPDVIMVGEIRDAETAKTVVQASLSGHLVLSSLHTNDATAAVTRMMDLGIEQFLIASGLSMVIAQRLIRLNCTNCARPTEPDEGLLSALDLDGDALKGGTLTKGEGCSACGQTGYLGRTGIFEVLPMSRLLHDFGSRATLESGLRDQARADGVQSLRQRALGLAQEGKTTLQEVLRVTHADAATPLTSA